MSKYSNSAGFLYVLLDAFTKDGKVYPFRYSGRVPDKCDFVILLLGEPGNLTTDALQSAILGTAEKRLPAELRRLEGFPIAWLMVHLPKTDTETDAKTARCEVGPEISPPAMSTPTPPSKSSAVEPPKPYSKTPSLPPVCHDAKTQKKTPAQQQKNAPGLELF